MAPLQSYDIAFTIVAVIEFLSNMRSSSLQLFTRAKILIPLLKVKISCVHDSGAHKHYLISTRNEYQFLCLYDIKHEKYEWKHVFASGITSQSYRSIVQFL